MAPAVLKRYLRTFITWVIITFVMLSAWGWEKVHSFATQVPRLLLILLWLGLAIYGAVLNTCSGTSGGKKENRGHRLLLWVAFPLLVVWFVYLPYADAHRLGISSASWLRWAGLVIFGVSMWIRIESICAQGPQFSIAVAIQEGHKLVTRGPYRWVRHPAYLGVIGVVLGISWVFGNLVVGLLAAWLVWVWMETRVVAEERLLLTEFGEQYSQYRSKTAKLLPFVY